MSQLNTLINCYTSLLLSSANELLSKSAAKWVIWTIPATIIIHSSLKKSPPRWMMRLYSRTTVYECIELTHLNTPRARTETP